MQIGMQKADLQYNSKQSHAFLRSTETDQLKMVTTLFKIACRNLQKEKKLLHGHIT